MTDKFFAEHTNSGWRVVRYVAAGDGTPERIVLGQRFLKRQTAEKRAYELQVAQERHYRRPIYLGD
jgi:hypothetical protein